MKREPDIDMDKIQHATNKPPQKGNTFLLKTIREYASFQNHPNSLRDNHYIV